MKQTEEFEKTMEETTEMTPETSEGKETPKNKKAIRDLIVVILIFAAFPIVLRGGGGLFRCHTIRRACVRRLFPSGS